VPYPTNPVTTSTLPSIANSAATFNLDDWMSPETYDSNGNTLTTGGKSFSYDSENHLMSMNGGAVKLIYDGDGNRVAKIANGVTTQYLVDDLNPTGYAQVVEEVVNGAVTRQCTYGLQRINEAQSINGTWTQSFYGYDGGGSVRQLTNASAAITDTYNYDAFGNLLNSTGTTPNSYLYRGEQYDSDLSLYYLRARYYNPATGRFMSRDLLGGKTFAPKSLHKYLYASGDPVNRIDPRGREDLLEYAFMAYHLTIEGINFGHDEKGCLGRQSVGDKLSPTEIACLRRQELPDRCGHRRDASASGSIHPQSQGRANQAVAGQGGIRADAGDCRSRSSVGAVP
jgi:RHS repeat-associated protein